MGLPSHGEQGDYDAGVELIAEGLPESYLECTPSVSPHGLHPFTFFLIYFFHVVFIIHEQNRACWCWICRGGDR
jgi:hypothetical protein